MAGNYSCTGPRQEQQEEPRHFPCDPRADAESLVARRSCFARHWNGHKKVSIACFNCHSTLLLVLLLIFPSGTTTSGARKGRSAQKMDTIGATRKGKKQQRYIASLDQAFCFDLEEKALQPLSTKARKPPFCFPVPTTQRRKSSTLRERERTPAASATIISFRAAARTQHERQKIESRPTSALHPLQFSVSPRVQRGCATLFCCCSFVVALLLLFGKAEERSAWLKRVPTPESEFRFQKVTLRSNSKTNTSFRFAFYPQEQETA